MKAAAPPALASLRGTKTVLLTTYRRDGTPSSSPVSLAFDGDHAYFRTWHTSWKGKRLVRSPDVEVAPATFAGKATGPAIRARARLLAGDEELRARRALASGHPVLQGFAVPLFHRLMGYRTLHFELEEAGDRASA